jgi:hypothetical protein
MCGFAMVTMTNKKIKVTTLTSILDRRATTTKASTASLPRAISRTKRAEVGVNILRPFSSFTLIKIIYLMLLTSRFAFSMYEDGT